MAAKPSNRLELNRLAYFAAVVDAGAFTRAAERLGVTKAVVSQQVARLEEELGVTLLLRTTRKLALTEAGFASKEFAVVGISLFVSLLTLLAMIRIWMGVFWNPCEEPGAMPAAGPARRLGGPPLMVIPAVALVLCSLAIAAAAGPLFSLSERTATDLLHPSQYVHEVLGR